LRNDAFLAAALLKLEEFWIRVQRRDPPEADALPGTTEVIKRLWSEESGETIALDHIALDLADRLESAKLAKKAEEARVEELQNKLRTRLGSATFGALPDGSLLSLRTVERAGYAVDPCEFRQLRRIRPHIRRRKAS
jgi:hypothetical protein